MATINPSQSVIAGRLQTKVEPDINTAVTVTAEQIQHLIGYTIRTGADK